MTACLFPFTISFRLLFHVLFAWMIRRRETERKRKIAVTGIPSHNEIFPNPLSPDAFPCLAVNFTCIHGSLEVGRREWDVDHFNFLCCHYLTLTFFRLFFPVSHSDSLKELQFDSSSHHMVFIFLSSQNTHKHM